MRWFIIFIFTLFSPFVFAAQETSIGFFSTKAHHANIPQKKIMDLIKKHFDIKSYRAVKVQVIYNLKHTPDHLLVFLLKKYHHGFNLACVNIDNHYNVLSIDNNYKVTQEDKDQQPGLTAKEADCPDPSTEVIAFAPNDDDIEQKVTQDVATAAHRHGLKTVTLLLDNATRQNYLNYMSCPNLKGNFYDGDASPFELLTVDGFIYPDDFEGILAKKFRFKVTNIWLACQAFHNPMKTAVMDVAQSQKYAAGVNNLLVGPSDLAAACAMKAAFNHFPLIESFDDCYKRLDDPKDIWGIDGNGSNYFGV